MATERTYEGSELALFGKAVNWKAYWGRKLGPFVKGRVLEVGARSRQQRAEPGLSALAATDTARPDPGMCGQSLRRLARGELPGEPRRLRPAARPAGRTRLRHHRLHRRARAHRGRPPELGEASDGRPDGHLIVLSPAYQFLFSLFDTAIGHHRRYDRPGLLAVALHGLRPVKAFYLDSLGLLLSFFNRFLFRQSSPTPATIKLWDSVIVRLSRLLDPVLGFSAGRSVIAIWSKS